MKRFRFTMIALSLLCLILTACGGNTSNKTVTPTTVVKPTSTGPQKVTVTIGDFYVHASQTTFVTGIKYHFVVTNVGTHFHNFLIMPPIKTTAMDMADLLRQTLGFIRNIQPNETQTLDFTFDHTAPAGTLELSCHFGGHYETGMYQSIVVNAPAGASVSPYPTTSADMSTAPCDPMVTIKFVNGAYTPAEVSLKIGETFMVTNPDDTQFYTPTFSPFKRQMVTLGSPSNSRYIYIPFPGSFTLSSKEHPEAKATISVSKAAGETCGGMPTLVRYDANYSDPKNRYFFTPTQVTIKKGQRIRLTNLLDQPITFKVTPDIGLGEINIALSWSQDIEFMTEGTYTISSVQFPNGQVTVNVQGT
jgi:uncharacterized cupredoxin-like copper-binding protein/plastocyanin